MMFRNMNSMLCNAVPCYIRSSVLVQAYMYSKSKVYAYACNSDTVVLYVHVYAPGPGPWFLQLQSQYGLCGSHVTCKDRSHHRPCCEEALLSSQCPSESSMQPRCLLGLMVHSFSWAWHQFQPQLHRDLLCLQMPADANVMVRSVHMEQTVENHQAELYACPPVLWTHVNQAAACQLRSDGLCLVVRSAEPTRLHGMAHWKL